MSDIGVSIGQKFESEPVVIFGVNISENLELIKKFIAAFGIDFPVLMDSDQVVIDDYLQYRSTSPFPLDYIIDQQGKVAYHNTEYDPRQMTEVITNLLPPVEEEVSTVPVSFQLEQNYPNPFNPVTTISYLLPSTSEVLLIVYNLLGEEIARLVDGIQSTGFHQITWDASGVSSGIYFYRIQARRTDAGQAGPSAGGFTQTRKMLLLK